MLFDVVVVGLGLIGSAALRHLSAGETSVAGIGPAEPEDWAAHTGPFASHYDSGRITRRIDARFEWAVLASRSIDQYGPIEQTSGLSFHHPVGLLFVRNDQAGLARLHAVIERLGLPVETGTTDRVATEVPGFVLPSGWKVLREPGPAGFIDPRMMARAQLDVARRRGASIVRTRATGIRRTGHGFRVDCHGAEPVAAGRVLVATGPYLNDLLPRPLAARVVPEAVILAEVSPTEAQRLAGMPSLIYLLDHDLHDDVYIVPPTPYPDGRHYIKMGGSRAAAHPLESAAEKGAWMAGTTADGRLDSMRVILEELLPEVRFETFAMKPCLITDTATGLPYIDQVDDGLFVAAGGNGHAAKSADAIGALAADLVTSATWNDGELERSAFTAVYGEYEPVSGTRHGN